MVDELALARDKLAKDIVGDIVMSAHPEQALKKWRNIFNFSQKEVASYLGITSSVISDYESGRRKSPGIAIIKRYVEALLSLDMKRGGNVIRSFTQKVGSDAFSHAIIDIREFSSGVKIDEFCRQIEAEPLIGNNEIKIYGYTVIDSVKAISSLSFEQLVRVYGTTTQRALIFTAVTTGRTPMVAIKLTNLHPGLVVLHGIENVDDVAISIAEAESIPLAVCKMESIDSVIERLRYFR
ncbi:MAG TPA: helix-turn-helix domain-containing protein [Candidatus Aenigmarchaeota archaeon]|nr:MAG: transcriptional regulator [Candidatus Aenigmarchaeota archaeon]HDD46154.1 helix-turn-helix domain-containing protein [Candidatus Aenigmarchaeota archaeon]